MVNKCSAYGCKSGYNETDKNVRFHCFPLHNKELCDKWIAANPRKDFTPSKHSTMCSLHFQPSDYIADHEDTNSTRRKRKSSGTLVRRRLKPDAVPSIFENVPAYLTKTSVTPRSTVTATSSSRRQREETKLQELETALLAGDDVSSITLSELSQKLQCETAVPAGYSVLLEDNRLIIYWLTVQNDVPKVTASVTVNSDLTVVASMDGVVVPASLLTDLVTGPIERMSQLVNVMARVKAYGEDSRSRSLQCSVQTAVNVLKRFLENLDETDSDEHRKVSFVIEQLQLLLTDKYARHYSPQLMIMSFRIRSASSAAYKALLDENVLCIPSASTLEKVTRRLNSDSGGLDNSSYLKMRVAKLNQFERNVVLIIDEIYIAKRVEYSGGEILGLTPDGSVASTLLCFMVKSLTSKFQDIVAIFPMNKLTAEKQLECYKSVSIQLNSVSLQVVAISVDNATTNRKFFVDCLCGGTLTTSIIDSVTGQPIFLIFDPVHDIKNVYNNFQGRKIFQCPPMARDIPNGCTARFQDVVDLFNHEAAMPLKKAYRLTPAALAPKSIEKTSVKLATSVFNESTRDALQFYGDHEGKSTWAETAEFISLILKLWNVMNVKSSCKGKHKRNYVMDPVRSSQDWKLDFLREISDFLLRWETSKMAGLTKETFLALRHTCLALADCAAFLLDRLAFNFVLLGRLQSDPIESRFGWLRQLSGANYYVSMRQVVEGDRKIRALSLLRFSEYCLSEIDDAIQSETSASQQAHDVTADTIVDALTYTHCPSSSDANTIYYVSGAIARSVVRTNRCDSCKELLVTTDEHEEMHFDDMHDVPASTFLDTINRGGLCRPSEYTFALAVHCWRVYDEIKATDELKKVLLSSINQRCLFTKVMERAAVNQLSDSLLAFGNYCTNGHDLQALIVQRFFNCVAKNLVKELTCSANPDRDTSKKRKIAKLSSKLHH